MTSDELVPIYGRMLSPFIARGELRSKSETSTGRISSYIVVYRRQGFSQINGASHLTTKDSRGILKWNGEKSGGLVDDRADRENGISLISKFHFRGWHHKKRVNLPKAKREEVVFTSSLFYLF